MQWTDEKHRLRSRWGLVLLPALSAFLGGLAGLLQGALHLAIPLLVACGVLTGVAAWMEVGHRRKSTRAIVPAQQPVQSRVIPFMVPASTGPFVARTELVGQIVEFLVGDEVRPTVTIMALCGAGGFGKTTLAAEACQRTEVRDHFPDGILWVTVGQSTSGPALAAKVNDLSTRLSGQRPTLADPMQAGFQFGELLGDRRVLLVVDDVWEPAQLEPFLQGGPGCIRVVTSRNRSALPQMARIFTIDSMRPDEAHELLTVGLPGVDADSVRRLLARTGSWPLLLALVNSQIRKLISERTASIGDAVAEVEHELREAGPTALDVTNPVERRQAVESTLRASIALLDEPDRARSRVARYVELAVFPENVDIPRSVLETYWGSTAGWTGIQVRRFCDELAGLSLLQMYQASPPRLRLHDVVYRYLRNRAGRQLRAMHGALLDSLRPTLPASEPATKLPWWSLPMDATYLWTYLPYHLQEAGRTEELLHLVTDLRYCVGKIISIGPVQLFGLVAVIADGEHEGPHAAAGGFSAMWPPRRTD
jgi:NB-ARC domain/APAF-1 helical domain